MSSEDIGKLPDASIGEAIARLPGITSQRLSGRADVISIRGFGPDYSTTLLNGREQTSTGDNRAVQFDQYPAEVINQVNIYKTPIASVIGQGIAGTIDLRTIRPLEFGHRVISVGGRAVYPDIGKLNPDAKKYGYRVNGVYVDQFADGRAGVVARRRAGTTSPTRSRNSTPGVMRTVPDGNKVVGGLKSYSTVDRAQASWPHRHGRIQADRLLDFDARRLLFELQGRPDRARHRGPAAMGRRDAARGPARPGFTASNGLITSGTFDNVVDVVRNVLQPRHAKLYSLGWNNRYDGPDGWHGFLDLSWNKTKRNELVFETYAGTGYQLLRPWRHARTSRPATPAPSSPATISIIPIPTRSSSPIRAAGAVWPRTAR